jgi:hypothetical protein
MTDVMGPIIQRLVTHEPAVADGKKKMQHPA